MKNVVEIKPVAFAISDITLEGDYSIKGKRRMLTEIDHQLKIDSTTPTMQKAMYWTFNKNFTVLKYEYDVDPKLRTEQEKRNATVVEEFWKNHPLMTINGKSHENTKAPLFNLVESTMVEDVNLKTFQNKLSIANMISVMSYEGKREVCFYYNVNPKGQTDNQLLLKLADFNDGVCMKDADNFLSTWGKNENADKEYYITINKAIIYGVIEERKNGPVVNYFLGQSLIGTSFNDLIAYCKREEQSYKDYITKRVAEADVFNEPKKKEAKTQAKAFVEDLEELVGDKKK